MPQPRTHKLRPGVAVARPGEMVIPNRPQQNSFNLQVEDGGGGLFGYKKFSFGELTFANWRGWAIDNMQATNPGDLVSIHGEFTSTAPQAPAGINMVYFDTPLGAYRTVLLPFVVSEYQVTDVALSVEIQSFTASGVPFQCRLEIP